MKRLLHFATAAILGVSAACAGTPGSSVPPDDSTAAETARDAASADTSAQEEMAELVQLVLSEMPADDERVRYETLTDEDFRIVANQLGVEVAAIKAVVKIEAGAKLQGFWAPGVPVANYVQSLFNKYSAKSKGRKIDAKVPSGLSGYALKEWTSLTNARKKNADAADMGTYWGMFQIGGFNYKLCGCQSVEEMVAKVCESEFSQLEMFAVFIRNTPGMLEALQKKDWAAFARKYNGPSYAKRGYHTRMAKEYAAYKNQPQSSQPTEATAMSPEIKSGTDQTPKALSEAGSETAKRQTPQRKKNRRKRTRK